jgi:phenylacetate-CoA ligase
VAARYLAFHLRALRRFGIEPQAGRGRVGVVLLGLQRACFTYVSVTPLLDESGLAKINLHPDDWRDPADRAAYLDALAPEVIAGDPISFAELLRLGLRHRPRALLSTAMALLPGLRAALEERFGCPVLDLYSMNEAGPVGVLDPAAGGHVLLQHRLYVEILDAAGRPVPPGARGEITLTGGFNFCLPLLRYRTGDQASLELRRGELVLAGLEGRPPVRFRTAAGLWVNNVDVTHALADLALPRFALRQEADGGLVLQLPEAAVEASDVRAALARVFGDGVVVRLEPLPETEDKVVQYTSALPGGMEA